jgi:predicted O-methyltransferase YrrM
MALKPAHFQFTIVISAFLLFLVQPIIAKQILPWFGGSANVWTTCLFFFQFVLLLGYIYAHALVRWVSPKQQAAVHITLLLLSCMSLPVLASSEWKGGTSPPSVTILLLLASTVGHPYFLLSTTSPLLQAWYARTTSTPYRLFALSNAASLAGLLAYPFLLEPRLTTWQQAAFWSVGYLAFVVSCGAVAAMSARHHPAVEITAKQDSSGKPTRSEALTWVVLAALGSLTLISVTSSVSQNIASMPLIWVVPLALYLITFILAFGPGTYRGWPVAGPALILAFIMVAGYRSEWVEELYFSLPLFMAGLFLVCLYCHGELAATKPSPRYLTGFYILVSLGGAAGSLGGSFMAPALLRGDFEMPITLAAVAAVFACKSWKEQNLSRWAGAGAAALLVITASVQIGLEVSEAQTLKRNFYSSLRVLDTGEGKDALRRLEHGRTEHGAQYLSAERRREPLSYYGRTSGVALALSRAREVSEGRPLAVGLIGLGAGALAAYGEPGDRFRFYEINPQVVEIAKSHFTYLADSQAQVSVELGDARLVLEKEQPQLFDVIIVDAFSGGAIPVHLLTREGLLAYLRHLAPSGVLLFHISNWYVDLEPALHRLALEERLEAKIVSDEPGSDEENVGTPESSKGEEPDEEEEGEEEEEDSDDSLSESDWVLMYKEPQWMGSASQLSKRATPLAPPQQGPAWTDEFNTILSAIRLRGPGSE